MRRLPQRGRTLMDLLVALSLLTIATTVAAPPAGRYLSLLRLRSAAWSLAADLQRARQRAISENRSQRLTLSTSDLDPGGGTPRSYAIAPADTGSPADSRGFASGIRCATPPGSFVEFDSRGLAAGGVSFTLVDPYGARTDVRVRSTGRIDFPS